jgi:hypothetical protein
MNDNETSHPVAHADAVVTRDAMRRMIELREHLDTDARALLDNLLDDLHGVDSLRSPRTESPRTESSTPPRCPRD